MDMETGAIVALVRSAEAEPSSIYEALSGGLRAELFQRGRPVFSYLLEHLQEHGEIAPEDVLKGKFPDFEFPDERPAALSFYIEELKKRNLHNICSEAMREAAQALKSKNPLEAVTRFQKLLADAQQDARSSKDVSLRATAPDRAKAYEELKTKEGLEGLPTPWPALDQLTLGWKKGEFIVVTARLGTGKTWFLVLLAAAVHAAGFLPLVISREMSTVQIARRLDALRAKVPHFGVRSGTLDEEQEKRFMESLERFTQEADFIVSGDDAAMGAAALSAKIDQLRPDIVLVDGLYLLQDDLGQSGWEGITNTTRAVKRVARGKEIPIVATTQLNREGAGEKVSTANIAYSDSVGQDADVVIALVQTEDMRLNFELTIKVLKQRDGTNGELRVRWDLALMDFAALDEPEPEDEAGPEDEIPF